MAVFNQGFTLKGLLENPDLLYPKINGLQSTKTNEKSGTKHSATKQTGSDQPNQSAFLGPDIWGKNTTAEAEDDLNFEYMDLDDFLCENGLPINDMLFGDNFLKAVNGDPREGSPSPARICQSQLQQVLSGGDLLPEPRNTPPIVSPPIVSPPVSDGLPVEVISEASVTPSGIQHTGHIQNQPTVPESASNGVASSPAGSIENSKLQAVVQVDFNISPTDIQLANVPGREDFNPAACPFAEEELRPQPMIKKARKVFVTDELKDDRYWTRRTKNNVAAKRSRDARRIKENQITLRAAFLEKQNAKLLTELEATLEENTQLKLKLAKYEGTSLQ